jgi:hypothetical protein
MKLKRFDEINEAFSGYKGMYPENRDESDIEKEYEQKHRKYTYEEMEKCWMASRMKRFDTGVPVHRSFDEWIKTI